MNLKWIKLNWMMQKYNGHQWVMHLIFLLFLFFFDQIFLQKFYVVSRFSFILILNASVLNTIAVSNITVMYLMYRSTMQVVILWNDTRLYIYIHTSVKTTLYTKPLTWSYDPHGSFFYFYTLSSSACTHLDDPEYNQNFGVNRKIAGRTTQMDDDSQHLVRLMVCIMMPM